MAKTWTNPTPPRPDQIDRVCPVDWSHPQALRLVTWPAPWLSKAALAVTDLTKPALYALVGNPTYVPQYPFDRVMAFDGNDYGARVVDRAILPISFSIWFTVVSVNVFHRVLTVGTFNSIGYTGFTFDVTNTGALAMVIGDTTVTGPTGGRFLLSSSSVVAANTLYHVAGCMVNGTTGLLYLNGRSLSLTASGTGGTMAAGNRVELMSGFYGANGRLYGTGRIADVRVWYRALAGSALFNLWHPGRRWGMLRTLNGKTTVYVPSEALPISIGGTIACQSAVIANLSVETPISSLGSAVGASNVAGSLSVAASLTSLGAAAGMSTIDGSIGVAFGLTTDGGAIGQSTVDGELVGGLQLSGSADAQSMVTANLGGAISLASLDAAAGRSTVDGSLSVAVGLSCEICAEGWSEVAGELTLVTSLTGSVDGGSQMNGDVGILRALLLMFFLLKKRK